MEDRYKAADLQNPFTVLRSTPTADGAGGSTQVEAQVGSTHFAKLITVRGDERTLNDGLAATVEVVFVTWAAIDIRSTDVLLHNGIRYNVRSIAPPGTSRFQKVTAESGVVS